MMITIFTPTYNRANLLVRLYTSLLKQKCFDFEWLVIDDGSTDNTKELINSFIEENKIHIRYIYQPNQGKASAYNKAITICETELLFCVDSDDYLPDYAVEEIKNCWENSRNQNISGIIALKMYEDGKLLSNLPPKNLSVISLFDLVNKFKCKGEFSLVYNTFVLKKYSFPCIKEKFITESVLYDQIDKDYDGIILNKAITICEYQNDGLTRNIHRNMIENPLGYKIYYSQRIDMAHTAIERINYMVRYHAFNNIAKSKDYKYVGHHKLLLFLTRPIGFLMKLYYVRGK